jgi:hypothetical protein
MTHANLYNALKPLKFYDRANGKSRFRARAAAGFKSNIEPERKIICRDVAFPTRDRIESIAFLVFGIVASAATVLCFSELSHLLNSGALEHFVHLALR